MVYSASNERDIQFLINFTKIFQPNKQINSPTQLSTQTSIESNESVPLLDSVTREKSLSDSQSSMKIPLSVEEEKKIWEILKNLVNRKFLLENLSKSRDTTKDSGVVALPIRTYKYLQKFLEKIFESINNFNSFFT